MPASRGAFDEEDERTESRLEKLVRGARPQLRNRVVEVAREDRGLHHVGGNLVVEKSARTTVLTGADASSFAASKAILELKVVGRQPS